MGEQVPASVKKTAHSLCSRFLGGHWAEIAEDQITVRCLPGGLTNELYLCSLKTDTKNGDSCPKEVVLRLYGKSTPDVPSQLQIVRLLASKKCGPKLYGCFEEGRLEEYFPSTSLTIEQMRSPAISEAIAKKIALIQQIQYPAKLDNQDWLLQYYDEFCRHFDKLKDIENLVVDAKPETKQIARRLCLSDFETEIQFVKSLLNQHLDMPRVFSNNDLHQNNILLIDESRSKLSLSDRIVLIDFEYASNNYRAYEIANHLCEWQSNYKYQSFPFVEGCEDWFPSDQQVRLFVTAYLNECKALEETNKQSSGKNEDSSLEVTHEEVDKFINDMQPFIIASHLFWTLWAVNSAILDPSITNMWHIADMKWSFYCSYKQKILTRKSRL